MLLKPAQVTLPAAADLAVRADACDALAPKTKRTKKTRPLVPGNRGL